MIRHAPILIAALAASFALAGCEKHDAKLLRGAGHAVRGERHMERDGHMGLRRACRADIEQYCAADQKGRERRMCLQDHRDKLSDDCKKALDQRGNGGGRHGRKDKDTDTDSGDD